MICSRYKVTIYGVASTILLDVGDDMMEEPDVAWEQSVQAARFVRGRNQRMIGRGNRAREIRFSKMLTTADEPVSDFRTWLIDSGSEIELASRCHASITIYDADKQPAANYVLRNAQVMQVTGRIYGTGQPFRSYLLRGGELIESDIEDFYLRDHEGELILDSDNQPIITI